MWPFKKEEVKSYSPPIIEDDIVSIEILDKNKDKRIFSVGDDPVGGWVIRYIERGSVGHPFTMMFWLDIFNEDRTKKLRFVNPTILCTEFVKVEE